MPFPHDPKLRGLAAALFHSDIPPWEYDIRAVPPGTEPLRVSDWHRRHGRANDDREAWNGRPRRESGQ